MEKRVNYVEDMKADSSKVIIHMVSSLDGYIAKKDNSVSWLKSVDQYEKGKTLTKEEIEEYLNSIDCYVMGSKTYEHALSLGWPYGEKPVFVISNRELASNKQNIEFYSGDLIEFITQLKAKYKSIWMVGGAHLTKLFLQKTLADEIIISIMPIILGDGLLFFDYIGQEISMHLLDVAAYKDGMVELHYEIVKE